LLKAKGPILESLLWSKSDLKPINFACGCSAAQQKMASTTNAGSACMVHVGNCEPLPALPATQIGDFRMNDMFGKIIVCGDYEGDLKAIVDVLNSLLWNEIVDSLNWLECTRSAGERQWTVKQSRVRELGVPGGGANKRREIIVPNGRSNVTLRPIGDIFVLEDGRRCFAKDADESFIEQWEADKDDGARDWDKCTLSELSALISPHLNKGTIEFVAVGASWADVRHERLLVRSDGSAEYHSTSSLFDSNSGTNTDSEYYEPESSKGAPSRKHSRSRGSRHNKSFGRKDISIELL